MRVSRGWLVEGFLTDTLLASIDSIYLHTAQKRLELMKKLAGGMNLPGLNTDAMGGGSMLAIPGMGSAVPSLNIANNVQVQNNFLAGNRPATSLVPTNYIVLINMFTETDYKSDPSFLADLKEDVGEECRRYGEVTDVFVAVKSPCGAVFVLFTSPTAAVTCAKTMDGRNFNQRPIASYCISEDTLQDELQKNL